GLVDVQSTAAAVDYSHGRPPLPLRERRDESTDIPSRAPCRRQRQHFVVPTARPGQVQTRALREQIENEPHSPAAPLASVHSRPFSSLVVPCPHGRHEGVTYDGRPHSESAQRLLRCRALREALVNAFCHRDYLLPALSAWQSTMTVWRSGATAR